jgi:hypothetical protein
MEERLCLDCLLYQQCGETSVLGGAVRGAAKIAAAVVGHSPPSSKVHAEPPPKVIASHSPDESFREGFNLLNSYYNKRYILGLHSNEIGTFEKVLKNLLTEAHTTLQIDNPNMYLDQNFLNRYLNNTDYMEDQFSHPNRSSLTGVLKDLPSNLDHTTKEYLK